MNEWLVAGGNGKLEEFKAYLQAPDILVFAVGDTDRASDFDMHGTGKTGCGRRKRQAAVMVAAALFAAAGALALLCGPGSDIRHVMRVFDARSESLEAGDENGPGADDSEAARRERPRVAERRGEREEMVADQIEERGVADVSVLDAMRNVPRHLFVPERNRRNAYADRPLPIGHGQTISQPYIVAYMTEQLSVGPGDRALEIGTGSGYQAAVLAELTPHVYSIEIIEELAQWGEKNLKDAGYGTVEVKAGDGYFGWEKYAPFDRIIVTAAAGHVPSPLAGQLAHGGKMIIPVGSPYETQYLILLRKDEDGRMSSEHLLPVRFVPMTGRALAPDE